MRSCLRLLVFIALVSFCACKPATSEPVKSTDEEKAKAELKSLNEDRQKEWGPKK